MEDLENKDGQNTEVGTSEETNTEATNSTLTEITDYVNRFVPGSDVSTPEAQIESLLKIVREIVPIYDKLWDAAENSPESAAFISDFLATGNPIKSLVRNFDPEEVKAAIEVMTEDDDMEEDRNIYREKITQRKTRMEEIEKNRAESEMSAKEFVDELTPSEEDLQAFVSFCDGFLKDWLDSKMPKENWMILWKGFKHDANVSEAEEAGRITGRNEKIITEKATRKDLADAMPEMTGASTGKLATPERPKSFAAKFMEDL